MIPSTTAWYILQCGIHRVSPVHAEATGLAGNPGADGILRRIQDDLIENPERGKLVKGLGGIRKARASNPARGEGKRGGYRYLYIYLAHRAHVHLLPIPDKDEQEDLTTEQRNILRRMARDL